MLLCDKGWYHDRLYGHESQFAGFCRPARCLAWQIHLFGHDQFSCLTVLKHSSRQGGKTWTRPGIDPSICPELGTVWSDRLWTTVLFLNQCPVPSKVVCISFPSSNFSLKLLQSTPGRISFASLCHTFSVHSVSCSRLSKENLPPS